jgi:hypothetical protein
MRLSRFEIYDMEEALLSKTNSIYRETVVYMLLLLTHMVGFGAMNVLLQLSE